MHAASCLQQNMSYKSDTAGAGGSTGIYQCENFTRRCDAFARRVILWKSSTSEFSTFGLPRLCTVSLCVFMTLYLRSVAHKHFPLPFDISFDGIASMNDSANRNFEQNARRSLIPIRRLLGFARQLFHSQSAFQFMSFNVQFSTTTIS